MRFEVVEPSTGRVVDVVPGHGAEAVERRITAARLAQQAWAARPVEARAAVLVAWADLLGDQADVLAELMAREVGKPVAQGVAEVQKSSGALRFYAAHAHWLDDEPVDIPDADVRVASEPIGTILAIMPWNFPVWQVVRFAAPALLVGNGFLLKHAPSCPGVAQHLERLLVAAGAPDGLAPLLIVDNDATAELIADDRVAAVTLTGSDRAGSAVARIAGAHLKKCVLELGGSDPFIVLDDAEIGAAASTAARARLQNAGQSCIAAKRFLVQRRVADRFIEAFRAELAAVSFGDPYDPETKLGPLARRDLRRTLHEQVRQSIERGARLALGGEIPETEGFFYPPTLLTDCAPGMPAWDEELFGPVAAVQVIEDDEAAIVEANRTVYGLGASVWTADRARAERFGRALRCGSVFVNGMTRSDVRVPFGGVKKSGYGRELALDGLREWVNRKTVWVDPTPG